MSGKNKESEDLPKVDELVAEDEVSSQDPKVEVRKIKPVSRTRRFTNNRIR
jgi:hypothetical protein